MTQPPPRFDVLRQALRHSARFLRSRRRGVLVFGTATVLLACAIWFALRGTGYRRGPAHLAASPMEMTVTATDDQSRVRSVQFLLTNTGGEALAIESVEGTCGCAQPRPPPIGRLAPGESTNLEVQLELPPTGTEKHAVVRIATKPPATPKVEIQLTLRGQQYEVPFLAFAPSMVYLVRNSSEQAPRGEVRIRAIEREGSEPWVAALRASQPDITAALQEAAVVQDLGNATIVREYRWEATAPSRQLPRGLNRGSFQLEVRHRTPQQLPLIGFEVAAHNSVRLVPDRVHVMLSRADEAAIERVVLVRADDSSGWQVTRAQTGVDWLEAGLPDSTRLHAAVRALRIRVLPTALPTEFRDELAATVAVETSHPEGARLELPAVVRRRKSQN